MGSLLIVAAMAIACVVGGAIVLGYIYVSVNNGQVVVGINEQTAKIEVAGQTNCTSHFWFGNCVAWSQDVAARLGNGTLISFLAVCGGANGYHQGDTTKVSYIAKRGWTDQLECGVS